MNHEVNKAGLVDILGEAGDTNIQGEDQQKLDVYANEIFMQTLTSIEKLFVVLLVKRKMILLLFLGSDRGNDRVNMWY